MRTFLAHVEIKVSPANLAFYKEFFAFAGWPVLHEDGHILGLGGTGDDSLWFAADANGAANDHDGPGMNHLGIGAPSIADVDTVVGWLKAKGMPALFETPRHRPEFAAGPDQTYYQVMFETPDGILFEVVYTGPK
jgi:catechol 2,3-dioxygenase-like lactoylglutathione lyase family enzyme